MSNKVGFPDLFISDISAQPATQLLIQTLNGFSSSITGIAPSASHVLDGIETQSTPYRYSRWMGYQSDSTGQGMTRTVSGRVIGRENKVYDVMYQVDIELSYTVNYAVFPPVLHATLSSTYVHDMTQVGGPGDFQENHTKSHCVKRYVLALKSAAMATPRVDTSANRHWIKHWGSRPTILQEKDYPVEYHGTTSERSMAAYCLGTLVCTVDGWQDIISALLLDEKSKSYLMSSALKYIYREIDGSLRTDPSGLWSHIQEDALQQSRIISNNMAMFVHDIANLRDDLMNLIEAGDKLKGTVKDTAEYISHYHTGSHDNPGEVIDQADSLVKAFDNVYLPVKYGYGLTISEAWDLGQKLTTIKEKYSALFKKFQCRSRRSLQTRWGKGKACYLANVHVKDNKFSQLYAAVFNSGFWPTLENAWDFIPYSFCVDWIVTVGDLLQAFDLYGYTCNLDADTIFHTIILDDLTVPAWDLWPAFIRFLNADACVKLKYYHREIMPSFDPPPLDVSCPLVEQDLRRWPHYVEAFSLITQRL